MTFFDAYSYKKKNFVLLVLMVLLAAVIYKRSVKTTLDILQYKQELNQKLERATHAIQNIKYKQQHISLLNRNLGEENNTVEKVQQGFLNFFARKASHLSVHQIDEVLTYKHPDFSIKTHRIVLKGGFIGALRFLYDLENQFKMARLIHVSFEYKKYSNDDRESLYTCILLQNYLR